MSDKKCWIDGCEAPVRASGLCSKHYQRQQNHGDPNFVTKRGSGIRKHWMYSAWAGMVNRCHNPNNSSYHQYGARGIKVCNRWRRNNGFTKFLEDMSERPEGMTLDRIDANGPYSPENCRWATHKEQRVNQSEGGKERQRAGASAAATRQWAERRAADEDHAPDWQKDAANVR